MTAPSRLTVRVYYEDTDFSGAVYHASYLRFMERARTEMLRERGIEQGAAIASGSGGGYGFVVRAMNIDFLRPARMDDLLIVETRMDRLGAATLELDQRVLRGDEELASAKVRIACVIGGRAARIPSEARARLSASA